MILKILFVQIGKNFYPISCRIEMSIDVHTCMYIRRLIQSKMETYCVCWCD